MIHTKKDLNFLRECCDICVAELSPKARPAVHRAAAGLRPRYNLIANMLDTADTADEAHAAKLQAAADRQAHGLALVLDTFTPAVRLDRHERSRLQGIRAKGAA